MRKYKRCIVAIDRYNNLDVVFTRSEHIEDIKYRFKKVIGKPISTLRYFKVFQLKVQWSKHHYQYITESLGYTPEKLLFNVSVSDTDVDTIYAVLNAKGLIANTNAERSVGTLSDIIKSVYDDHQYTWADRPVFNRLVTSIAGLGQQSSRSTWELDYLKSKTHSVGVPHLFGEFIRCINSLENALYTSPESVLMTGGYLVALNDDVAERYRIYCDTIDADRAPVSMHYKAEATRLAKCMGKLHKHGIDVSFIKSSIDWIVFDKDVYELPLTRILFKNIHINLILG